MTSAPVSERQSGLLAIDRAAILWALLGGVSGFTGGSVLQDDHQPAVVAQTVEMLREDVRSLSVEVRDLRTSTDRDRWTRSDQQEWLRESYGPSMQSVQSRLRALENSR